MFQQAINSGEAYIFCYDITSMSNFNDLIEFSKKYLPSIRIHGNKKCILVGTKLDAASSTAAREVSVKVAFLFARKSGFHAFYETSSLKNINVNACFKSIFVIT